MTPIWRRDLLRVEVREPHLTCEGIEDLVDPPETLSGNESRPVLKDEKETLGSI